MSLPQKQNDAFIIGGRCGSQVSSNLYVSGDRHKDLPNKYHHFVEVKISSSCLTVWLWRHISYDIIVRRISVQSFVDERTIRLVPLTTRDSLYCMTDICDAHMSLVFRLLDSWSSLHLSSNPGGCARYESKVQTTTTFESNLPSFWYG